MKVISVINHKGGVGKTTVTLNFGAELAEKGYKVLLIDFDAQGNLSKGVGLKDHESIKDTIASAMEKVMDGDDGECNLKIYKTEISDSLDIIPCNIAMANTNLKLQLAIGRELVLKKIISHIKESYDYDFILIDNAPSIALDFQNSIMASDEVLIVTSPDVFSANGMTSLLREYLKVRKYFGKDNLKIAGILINNADRRTVFTKEMIEVIKSAFEKIKIFNTIIPQSVRVKESQANSCAIKDYEKENKAGLAFKEFVEEYLNENGVFF